MKSRHGRAIILAVCLSSVVAAPIRGQTAADDPAIQPIAAEAVGGGALPSFGAVFTIDESGQSGRRATAPADAAPLSSRGESTFGQVQLPPPRQARFKFAQQVLGDFKHLPSWETVYWLSGGGVFALAVHPKDDDANAGLGRHDKFFNPGQTVGSAYVQTGAALTTYIVGRVIDNRRVKHLGTDMLSAQLVAQALTQALKFSVQRERPDGSNHHSFPSGHASATFATATVLQRHLGWKAAVPTYAAASYVAMSRLQENRHFLSDVIFGAALGVAVGRTTTRHGDSAWTMIADVSPHAARILVTRLGR
jgi:membrane-associated phospholipid phosphatase